MSLWPTSSTNRAAAWLSVFVLALSGCAQAHATSDDWLDELEVDRDYTDTQSGGDVGKIGDACPDDPLKLTPGVCGCGVSDKDFDGDGTFDCFDHCPNDPNKTEPGACGCGIPDKDRTGDGKPDCDDNCPDDPDKFEPGVCGCGTPDNDSDKDGTLDCNDDCPDDPAGDVETDWYPDCDNDGEPSSFATQACSEEGAWELTPCFDGEAPDGGWSENEGVDCDDEDSSNPCPCGQEYSEGACV